MSRKGPKGELEVARLVQAWWRRLEPDAVFVRTPGSGGWGGARLVQGFKARGDLMSDPATCSRFPFCVEVKREQALGTDGALAKLLAGEPSQTWRAWEQAQQAADADGMRPMLWVRGDRRPWTVLVEDARGVWLFKAEDFLKIHPRVFALPKPNQTAGWLENILGPVGT